MGIIRALIHVYMYVVVIDAILSYFPNLDVHLWRKKLKELADYSCAPIREKLPKHLPLDFSPIIVVFVIELFFFLW